MGRLTAIADIRAAVRATLTPPPLAGYDMGDLKEKLVVADDGNRYIIIRTGWFNHENYYGIMQDVELLDGKVLIHQDTQDGELAQDLEDAGIDPASIVEAYAQDTSAHPVAAS